MPYTNDTVDNFLYSDALFVDHANQRVGIGTDTPDHKLTVVGTVASLSDTPLRIGAVQGGHGLMGFLTRPPTAATVTGAGISTEASQLEVSANAAMIGGRPIGTTGMFISSNDLTLRASGNLRRLIFPNFYTIWDALTLPVETGTFTPALGGSGGDPTSITYSVQQGKYRRVGNIVTFSLNVQTSAVTGGTGNVWIRNMPFTSRNTNPAAVLTMRTVNLPLMSGGIPNNARIPYAAIGLNTTIIGTIAYMQHDGNVANYTLTQWGNNGGVIISGTYDIA